MHHEMFQPVTSTMHMFSQNSLQLIVKFPSYASETTFIVAHCFDWPGLRRVPSVTVVLQLSSYRLDSNISCKVSLAFAFCYEHLLNRR